MPPPSASVPPPPSPSSTAAPPGPRPARSRRPARPVLAVTALFLAVAVGLAGVLATVVRANGAGPTGAAVVLALLPALLVVAALRWLDRYELEPPWLLVGAAGWGAGVATAVALLVSSVASVALDAAGAAWASVVVVAPVVEETVKGLGLLVVLLLRRREFDGVVDGVVYAGMVGVGFACVEDVLYFSTALTDTGTGGLAAVFVVRAVLSPFAHPLLTMATGVGLGLAVSRRGRAWAPLLGLVVAVLLHALWNATTLVPGAFLPGYVVLQLPVFAGAVVVAVLARRREGRVLREQLPVYAAAGWITTAEAGMVASLPERRRARRWADRTRGAGAREAMETFQQVASELAFLRDRVTTGTAPRDARTLESAALRSLWLLRREVLETPAVRPRAPAASGLG